jgi:hypothetical protein
MAPLNTMTGNRAIVKLNGAAVGIGLVNNADTSDDYGLVDVDGLGDAESIEMVPGKVSHTISFSEVLIVGKSLKDMGIVPDMANLLTQNGFDIEILDKLTNQTVEHYTGCKVANCSRNYGKHNITMQNVSFRSIHKEV